MKKKTVRKKSAPHANKSYFRYVVITFVIVVLVLAGKVGYQTLTGNNVLGTSSFLAKDDAESLGSSDANKTPEPQEIKNNDSGTNSNSQSAEIHTPEPRELHTPEPNSIKPQLNSVINLPPEKVEVQTEGNKTEINAAAPGSQVQLKTEDNGSLSVHVKKADGTEVQLETHALDQVNESLKENDIEIGTKSAGGFEITNKDTKAETEFPVSVNLASKTLSVDTPLGTKNLTVLPDQAVQNLLNQRVIDKVTQTSVSTNGAQLQLVQLRLYGNNPVFQVQGVDDKKLFGVIPVGVQKTTLVSAETGQIVNTNTDLLNTILNLLSVQ